MLDLLNTQYDSFIFWRTPIPVIDLTEIEILLPNIAKSVSGREGADAACQDRSDQDEAVLTEYSSFNFWRSPIATFKGIDLELL